MNAPMLSQAIFSSADADEAQSFLASKILAGSVVETQDAQDFRLRVNAVELEHVNLAYADVGTDCTVDCGSVEDTTIFMFGINKPSVSTVNGEPVTINNRGIVVSHGDNLSHLRQAGSGEFIVRAATHTVNQKIQAELDRRLVKPTVFGSSIDLTTGTGAQARATVMFIAESIDRDPTLLESPLIRANFNELLLTAIVSLPSNYSEDLLSENKYSGAPRLVRQAEEFIVTHSCEPITINDILKQSGCSKKALFSNFRKYRDYTPTQFLTETRLKLAHHRLQRANPGDSVTAIAYDCGFSHMGRFSDVYRKRYGANPSETLRRALH